MSLTTDQSQLTKADKIINAVELLHKQRRLYKKQKHHTLFQQIQALERQVDKMIYQYRNPDGPDVFFD